MDIGADEDHYEEEMAHNVVASTPIRASKDDETESPTRRRRMLPTRHGGSENLYKQKDEDVIGHIKELRRKLSNEHELNEVNIDRKDDSNANFNGSIEMKDSLSSDDENGVDKILLRDVDIGEMEVVDDEGDGRRKKRGISEMEDADNHDSNGAHTPGAAEDQMSATESEADRVAMHLAEEERKERVSMEVNEEQKQQLREILDDLATPYAQQNAISNDVLENGRQSQVRLLCC